jgi:cob(I)alamin adenosyltransferase
MKIYTKNGDQGKTRINHQSLEKDALILDVLGHFDELNSSLGLLHTLRNKKIKKIVLQLQDDCLAIGADLARKLDEFAYMEKVEEFEKIIDELSEELPHLKNFILPGGSRHAAQLQISRSIARRLERRLVTLKNSGKYPKKLLKGTIVYVNRLSDLLFVMARYVNFKLGIKEIIFKIKND